MNVSRVRDPSIIWILNMAWICSLICLLASFLRNYHFAILAWRRVEMNSYVVLNRLSLYLSSHHTRSRLWKHISLNSYLAFSLLSFVVLRTRSNVGVVPMMILQSWIDINLSLFRFSALFNKWLKRSIVWHIQNGRVRLISCADIYSACLSLSSFDSSHFLSELKWSINRARDTIWYECSISNIWVV